MNAAAVLFDLDGVLVDSEPLWEEELRALLAAHGRAYREEVARRHRGRRLPDVVAILMDGYGLDGAPDALGADLLRRMAARYGSDELRAVEGAAELLGRVRAAGRRCALASSSPRPLVEAALARFGWTFDAVCTGDEVERGKPAPDLFLLAARRLGLDPAACVVLEDSASGVAAARAARMACVVFGDEALGGEPRAATLAEAGAYLLR